MHPKIATCFERQRREKWEGAETCADRDTATVIDITFIKRAQIIMKANWVIKRKVV